MPAGDGNNTANPPASGNVHALRVLDAAANRAREGLRVVEDYVRFVLDDRHLTELGKRLRHDLAAVVDQVPLAHRLAARETQADVGTLVSTPSEQRRDDLVGVLAANCLRLEEALRSLEEFGKLVRPDLAARFEQLRYRAYTFPRRAIETTRCGLERLASARLLVLLDGRPSLAEFEALARHVVQAAADVIQLRDKQLTDRQLIERGRLLRAITRGQNTLLVINDRPDLAVLLRADGVHLGQEDLSVKDARSIVGPEPARGRLGPHTRAGPSGGPRRGQLPGRWAHVPFRHQAFRRIPRVGVAAGRGGRHPPARLRHWRDRQAQPGRSAGNRLPADRRGRHGRLRPGPASGNRRPPGRSFRQKN